MAHKFKTEIVAERSIYIPIGATAGQVLTCDNIGGTGHAAWADAPPGTGVFPPSAYGCYFAGTTSVTGDASRTMRQITAGSVARDPEGVVSGGNTYTVPTTGTYRLLVWMQYQNANVNTDARMRIYKNAANLGDMLSIVNGAAVAIYPSASAHAELAFAAGDAITFFIGHSDPTVRNISHRISIDRLT